MARISNVEISNFDQSKETTQLAKQGVVSGTTGLYWPKFTRLSK